MHMCVFKILIPKNENNIQPAQSFINHNAHSINNNYYYISKTTTYTSGLPFNTLHYYSTTHLDVFCIKLKTNVNGNYEDINGCF